MNLQPRSPQEAAEIIRSAREAKKALIPAGRMSRLKHWPKIAQAGPDLISTAEMKKIISVEPENLLAIVEAGLTPAELRPVLEGAGLHWPVSGLDKRSLGAIMAEGAVSLETMARGPMTDWILGLSFIEPSGRLITSGGRTLKDVSGYDLTRMQWKAWGSLGLSAVFVLKCLPLPEASKVFELELPNGPAAVEAAERIIKARIFPQSLHLLYEGDNAPKASRPGPLGGGRWSLLVWLSGFQEFVEAQGQAAMAAAGGATSVVHESGLDFWSKKSWPLEEENAACLLASRASLMELARELDPLKITSADIDLGGGLARLCFAAEATEVMKGLNHKSFWPQAPNLKGEIFLRLKKGLDPDDLFFPSAYYRP